MFKFGVIRIITNKSLEQTRSGFADDSLLYINKISDAYRNDSVIAYVISQTIVKLSHDEVTTEATSILQTAIFMKRFR